MPFISLQRRMWKQWGKKNKKRTEGKERFNFELYRDFNHTGMHCTMWSRVTWDYLLFREKCGMNYWGRASLTRRLLPQWFGRECRWEAEKFPLCWLLLTCTWKSWMLQRLEIHCDDEIDVTCARLPYLCGSSDVKGKCIPCWCFILS